MLHRIFAQIARVPEINNLHAITSELVKAARESLTIGTLGPSGQAR